MRTVSFPNPEVQQKLSAEFLCSYTNIVGEKHTGMSFKHSPHEDAGPCGRGAGRQNVQTLFLTPDGELFHAATGFLSAEDLLGELRFAAKTYKKIEQCNKPMMRKSLILAHTKRMTSLGFSQERIRRDNPNEEFVTGFNPGDNGIESPVSGIFGNVVKNRMLRDAKYIIRNPLIHRSDFEARSSALVGNRSSFFGSNPSMNALKNIYKGGGERRQMNMTEF